ncbi:glycosyltransferase [bacterium]|nr:MAG: glycosyltransferase [bacterium]
MYASDITFDLIKQKYGFKLLYKFSENEGDEVERLAIEKSTFCLYSSDWAAQSAVNTYGKKFEHVFVVPFGANISELPDYQPEIKITFKNLKILFLGVDWIRKGGDIVLKTYQLLKDHGVDVHLTICGCVPPIDLSGTDITIIPFLNKKNSDDAKRFDNLLFESQLLFVPSKEDCTPIAFCEAAAYGIPVISRDEGGISSIIKNGINGYCLPPAASEQEYFNIISKIAKDKLLYEQLSLNSRKMYLEKLN